MVHNKQKWLLLVLICISLALMSCIAPGVGLSYFSSARNDEAECKQSTWPRRKSNHHTSGKIIITLIFVWLTGLTAQGFPHKIGNIQDTFLVISVPLDELSIIRSFRTSLLWHGHVDCLHAIPSLPALLKQGRCTPSAKHDTRATEGKLWPTVAIMFIMDDVIGLRH